MIRRRRIKFAVTRLVPTTPPDCAGAVYYTTYIILYYNIVLYYAISDYSIVYYSTL